MTLIGSSASPASTVTNNPTQYSTRPNRLPTVPFHAVLHSAIPFESRLAPAQATLAFTKYYTATDRSLSEIWSAKRCRLEAPAQFLK